MVVKLLMLSKTLAKYLAFLLLNQLTIVQDIRQPKSQGKYPHSHSHHLDLLTIEAHSGFFFPLKDMMIKMYKRVKTTGGESCDINKHVKVK